MFISTSGHTTRNTTNSASRRCLRDITVTQCVISTVDAFAVLDPRRFNVAGSVFLRRSSRSLCGSIAFPPSDRVQNSLNRFHLDFFIAHFPISWTPWLIVPAAEMPACDLSGVQLSHNRSITTLFRQMGQVDRGYFARIRAIGSPPPPAFSGGSRLSRGI